MNTTDLLKKVRKIEIKTRGLSRHLFAGEYHSAFKGRGMSFSEVRDYQYGDDVRNIDWNVTARTGDPHVKIFEEERELTVMLLVDVSQSVYFGTRRAFKQEIITEICAVLAFSAINNNDKVGVLFFSDKVEQFIPPKKGKSHILRIIRELLDLEPANSGTDLGEALRYFNNVVKKRSIAFLLSDFAAPAYADALRVAARRHDLIGVQVYDPLEAALPNVGLLPARDAETGRTRWIDTGSRRERERYAARFRARVEELTQLFARSGADLMRVRTDADYAKVLHQFFQKRTA